ncbi:FecR family protein [Achromobacter xylosoxidans]
MKTASQPADRRQADIEREARAWIRLIASGQATLREADALRQWCSASERHAQAFAAQRQLWSLMAPAGLALQRQRARQPARGPAQGWGRRAFLGTALAGTAAAAVAAVVAPPLRLWPAWGEWLADYRTDTGDRRQFGLGERVQVDMNTQTSIALRSEQPGALRVELIAGEAAFDGQSSSAALTVVAGRGSAEARGARFELRNLEGTVCVTCLSGSVRVALGNGATVLGPNQRLFYDRRGLGAVQQIDPAETSAWRQGSLVFRNTPLAEVVAEINRYRRGRVVLLDGARGASALSGRFEIRDTDKVLVQIEKAFGLSATHLPGNVVVLA